MEHISWDELDKPTYFVLGPTMFLGVRALVYPSNLVKTRLQVQSKKHPLYRGTFDAFHKIARQEGMRGLYKGFGASTANVLTGNLYISVYELARKIFLEKTSVRYAAIDTIVHWALYSRCWNGSCVVYRSATRAPTLQAAHARR